MPLYVDPVRIEQVLTNLLINAAKYTPDGGRIIIHAEPLGDSAVFTVCDNGIGISEEMLPRVFDLFVQADSSGKNSEGGLGIGLALVRKVVELHGGSVRATSARQKPRQRVHRRAAPRNNEPPCPPTTGRSMISPPTNATSAHLGHEPIVA